MARDWFPSAAVREMIVRPEVAPLVYFVGAVGAIGFPVKIGLSSTVGFRRRLSQLQTGMPYELEPLVLIPGDMARERELHDKFAANRLRGEWFEYSREILDEIAEARRCHPDWRRLLERQ